MQQTFSVLGCVRGVEDIQTNDPQVLLPKNPQSRLRVRCDPPPLNSLQWLPLALGMVHCRALPPPSFPPLFLSTWDYLMASVQPGSESKSCGVSCSSPEL